MKRLVKVILISAGALGLTGCSAFEHNISVVYAFQTDAEVGTTEYTYLEYEDVTNIFNNVLLPGKPTNLKAIPVGEVFLGWSTSPEYDGKAENPAPLFSSEGIVHYKDVKDYAKDNKVVLYATVGERVFVEHDFVVAWYNKPATSGCTENVVKKMTEGITNHIKSAFPDKTDIVFKGYEGNVGGSCAAIEDDVMAGTLLPNIMIGWKGNVVFSAQSGLTYSQAKDAEGNILTFKVGEEGVAVKEDRYLITLSYMERPVDEITQSVVNWMQTDEGRACTYIGA